MVSKMSVSKNVYFCFLLQEDQERRNTSQEKSSSTALTTLPAGMGDTAGEILSKLQREHIPTDIQRLCICVTLRAYLALIL